MNTTNENRALTLDEIRTLGIEKNLQEMATSRALAGGVYGAKILDVEPYEDAEGRQFGRVKLQVIDDLGKDLRRISAKVSWDFVAVNDRADKPFRLYAAINSALGFDATSPIELTTEAKGAYVKVSFTDSYVVEPECLHESQEHLTANDRGEVWVSLTGTGEEATELRGYYLAKGVKPIFLVNNFFPY